MIIEIVVVCDVFDVQGPYQDLSVCTDQPRVVTRVQQHNRFTQIKEKCSKIITKNVLKSKPPLYPRPKSLSRHPAPQIDKSSRNLSFPANNRRNIKCASNQPRTIELKEVYAGNQPRRIELKEVYVGNQPRTIELKEVYGENGFELLNMSFEDSPLSPRSEPLDDQDVWYRSVESLDSGCDIETPRTSVSTVQENNSAHFVESLETAVSSKVISVSKIDEPRDSGKQAQVGGIEIVCDLQVPPGQSLLHDTEEQTGPLSLGEVASEKEDDIQTSFDKQSGEEFTSSDEEGCFGEQFKLFKPRTSTNNNDNKDKLEYTQQLRQKLSWKLAAERALRNSIALETVKENSVEASSTDSDRHTDYHDADLTDFVDRAFNSALSVRENISVKPIDILMGCFVPKMLDIPEFVMSDTVLHSQSSCESLNWSDGEACESND